MSEPSGSSNGSDAPPAAGMPGKMPFPRLSSFKLPRDLTLGAGAPSASKTNKKVFMPNLNVVRNKNKTVVPNLRENNKKDNERNRRDRHNNKNKQNGPTVLKSSGVFSEGIGASERVSSRSSYIRDSDSAPTLTRPVLRNKEIRKVDKELEEQKLKKALGQSHLDSSDDDGDFPNANIIDGPVRLPISAGGTLYSAKKDIKKNSANVPAVVIKKEPMDRDMMGSDLVDQKKYLPETTADAFDSTDIVGLLNSDKRKIMLIELPDNLPGRGPEEEIPQQKKKPAHGTEEESKKTENRCILPDLEEGRIGTIQIHKSGKVKLCIGDTKFDLSMGTQPCFRQDAVSISVNTESRTGSIINLGGIEKKLNIIPDWEELFKDVAI